MSEFWQAMLGIWFWIVVIAMIFVGDVYEDR